MNITHHDDDATTWRDLADQLTPTQIAELECSEHDFAAASLLAIARDYAAATLVEASCADVPIPDGARIDEAGWEPNRDRDGWSRSLVWRLEAPVRGVDVAVDGRQQTDGSVTLHVSLWAIDGAEMTSAQARLVAASLNAAADELEGPR